MKKGIALVCMFFVLPVVWYSGHAIAVDPNNMPSGTGQAVADPVTAQQLANQRQANEFNERIIQQKLESFETRASDLKWTIDKALGIFGVIMALVIAVPGFIAWKNYREFRDTQNDLKEAIRETKEYTRKAQESSKKAEDWEQKAQKACLNMEQQAKTKIEEFDKLVESKFVELDEKTKEHVRRIFEEAEKQRQLTEKWNKAVKADSEGKYELADKLWNDITTDDPNDYAAFNYWGATLGQWARRGGDEANLRLQQAFEKIKESLKINPDNPSSVGNLGVTLYDMGRLGGTDSELRFQESYECSKKASEMQRSNANHLNNAGSSLLAIAQFKKDPERELLLKKAKEMLLDAEKLEQGAAAYNLACIHAVQGDEENCKQWLLFAATKGKLHERNYALADRDLESVRDKDWFKAIKWKDDPK